jgi:23S rRNA G2445 N2-methylase RlmL
MTVDKHFAGREPGIRATYDALLAAAGIAGPFNEDPKKTSIHLNRRSVFAGVAVQKRGLVLTLKSTGDIQSSRIWRRQQASARRWYIYVKLSSPVDVDDELRQWLFASYELSG